MEHSVALLFAIAVCTNIAIYFSAKIKADALFGICFSFAFFVPVVILYEVRGGLVVWILCSIVSRYFFREFGPKEQYLDLVTWACFGVILGSVVAGFLKYTLVYLAIFLSTGALFALVLFITRPIEKIKKKLNKIV